MIMKMTEKKVKSWKRRKALGENWHQYQACKEVMESREVCLMLW